MNPEPNVDIGGFDSGAGLLGYNLYAYCKNNPVMYSDPNGNWSNADWFFGGCDWINNNIIQPVVNTVTEIKENIDEDISNFDSSNEDEDTVYSSNYFSCYKGVFVLNTPFDASFSFGLIGFSKNNYTEETLDHEYGHIQQFNSMGTCIYFAHVGVPSLTLNILRRTGNLDYDYYGAPWEAQADELGGVTRKTDNTPWSDSVYNSYFDLIKMFFQ